MFDKLIALSKNFWFWAVLVGLVFLALILKIFFLKPTPFSLKPPPPQISIPSPTIEGKPLPFKTVFSAPLGSLSAKLPAYKGALETISAEKARRIAQELGFDSLPREDQDATLGIAYFWTSEKASLSIQLDSPRVSYTLNSISAPSGEKPLLPATDRALKTVSQLLDKLELEAKLALAPPKMQYLKVTGDRFSETLSQGADFLRVGLDPLLKNYPLVNSGPSQSLISILLGREGEIAQFYWRIYFSQFSEVGSFALKNSEQIQSSLAEEGKIVGFEAATEGTWELNFVSTRLTQISLAYFHPIFREEFIQPIYILTGDGILSNGQRTKITVYLPAFAKTTPGP